VLRRASPLLRGSWRSGCGFGLQAWRRRDIWRLGGILEGAGRGLLLESCLNISSCWGLVVALVLDLRRLVREKDELKSPWTAVLDSLQDCKCSSELGLHELHQVMLSEALLMEPSKFLAPLPLVFWTNLRILSA
jgi:hypothetical protein